MSDCLHCQIKLAMNEFFETHEPVTNDLTLDALLNVILDSIADAARLSPTAQDILVTYTQRRLLQLYEFHKAAVEERKAHGPTH